MTKAEYEKYRKAKSEVRRLENKLKQVTKRLDSIKAGIKRQKSIVDSENTDYKTGYVCGLSWTEGWIAEVLNEND